LKKSIKKNINGARISANELSTTNETYNDSSFLKNNGSINGVRSSVHDLSLNGARTSTNDLSTVNPTMSITGLNTKVYHNI
jgi:hypothetical protein